jgi:UDP-glucose 4-epimerase
MTDKNDETLSGEPTIGITGAAGYIGSRVLARLQTVHPDWNFIALDNHYLGQVTAVGETEISYVDIRNRQRLEQELEGADVVIHLAAISGVDDCETNPDLAYDVNVVGTNNVAWFCRKTGAALAFPFSMAVLGDPEQFPITADLSRDPINWYARTKLLGEQAIETFAEGAFPAHLFMKSNLYGEHLIDGTTVSKSTVINLFIDCIASGDPLTVYEPGTQSRNFIHIKDVADVYVKSTEQLLQAVEAGTTGVKKYEVASDDDPSVMEVAETIAQFAEEEIGVNPEVLLVENPRNGEAVVEEFTVDTSRIREDLGWKPEHTVEESIRTLLRRHT